VAVANWVQPGTAGAFLQDFAGVIYEYTCPCQAITPVIFNAGTYEHLVLQANSFRLVLEVECFACTQKGTGITGEDLVEVVNHMTT